MPGDYASLSLTTFQGWRLPRWFSSALLVVLWWDFRRRISPALGVDDVTGGGSTEPLIVAEEQPDIRKASLRIASLAALAVVLLLVGAGVPVAATVTDTDVGCLVVAASVGTSLSGLVLGLWAIGDALERARPFTLQLIAVLVLTLGGLAWGRDAFAPPEHFSQGLAAMTLFSIGVGWTIGLLVYAILLPTLRRRFVGVLVTLAALASAVAAGAQVLID